MADLTAVDGHFSAVVVEHTDRGRFLRVYGTAVDSNFTGRIVIDRIRGASGAGVVQSTAVDRQDTFVADKIACVTSGIIVGSVPCPRVIRSSDQFTGFLRAAVCDGQRSEIADES